MEQVQENKMGTAPVLRLIIAMSLPAMFSMLIQALYNIVDSYFVAQISESALTAVSLAFPIQTLMIAVGVGTGVGINSLVARRLGEKRQADADCAASHGLLLGVFNWILFALFGIFFTKMFFGAFTDIEEIITMGTQYTSIVTICSFGLMIEVNMEKTLQADLSHGFPAGGRCNQYYFGPGVYFRFCLYSRHGSVWSGYRDGDRPDFSHAGFSVRDHL